MPGPLKQVEITLEIVRRKTFAIAYEWPGWARSGRDEDSALQEFLSYGPRYADVFKRTEHAFEPPTKLDALQVIERLEGNSTTAFGAPAIMIRNDRDPVDDNELHRFEDLLSASWLKFDLTLKASTGIELRKGPRGGGRDQEKILAHVIMADESYLSKLGWKSKALEGEQLAESLQHIRNAILAGLTASAHGEIPEKGPRGGLRWTPRYFVRRVIWHVLDHAWEIEDRMR